MDWPNNSDPAANETKLLKAQDKLIYTVEHRLADTR